VQKLLDGMTRARSARELKVRVLDEVGELFGAGATGLYLFGPDGNLCELYTRGVRDGFILHYEQLGRGQDPILDRALENRQPVHDGMVFRGESWQRSTLYRECGGPWLIRHYLCVPIVVDGQVRGTLNLGRRSEAHPFDVRDTRRAATICRGISARLRTLSAAPEREQQARPTLEELGRLSAERVHVRMHAAEMERRAQRLEAERAGALWSDVTSGRVAPLDRFDQGDRTYVLLPAAETPLPRRPLTEREADVVRRAAAGLANKEIAFELGISLNTVGSALLSARTKLGVASRVKLMEMARRLGLAD
jgi:DNA-binding CsgD family transcriptional regulator/GAF domain-containing protein